MKYRKLDKTLVFFVWFAFEAGCASSRTAQGGETTAVPSETTTVDGEAPASEENEGAETELPDVADEPPAEGCPTVASTLEEFLLRNQGRDGRSQESAFWAHSVAEEYRYLGSAPCGTSGTWQVLRQSLINGSPSGGPYDALEVRCSDGSEEAVMYFDVSRFYGRFECYE